MSNLGPAWDDVWSVAPNRSEERLDRMVLDIEESLMTVVARLNALATDPNYVEYGQVTSLVAKALDLHQELQEA